MNTINLDDFSKLDLRVGKILEAEKIENSEKLVKLQVSLGDEERQIIAGIGKSYLPEELVGRLVVVLANLEPKKLMGYESQGMILAASDETGLPSLLTVDKQISPGSKIK
ncbi:Methionine--tRNA ligase [bacterium HR34]|nr:Methionine--tRNA ligase [bacterium HR34]